MADQKLRVDLLLNSKGFSKGLNSASGRLRAFGSKISSVGKSLSLRITAPMVLAGGQAIRMAAKFDKSMTQIKTLVGVAGSEVDSMGQKVKQLASTTGVNAAEAAEALFFVTSAGLRGSEAMDVLEQSLKASALGLGETKTVADLATSAMNAYGSDTLGASDATDVLVSAVREGKLQADELSSVMGAVLPIASNMGVKFHEVGGAFAAMSRTGTPAAQAATQLNAILMAIMKPSEDAKKAMDELGLSQEGLRKQIKEEGLLNVFELLRQKSEENSGAFERVFGNVRALKGILDLTGASADATRQIMERMANATGITSDAYKELTKSSSFQLNKALNELNVLFTEVGAVLLETLLPIFVDFGKFVKNVATKFNSLSPEVKKFGVMMAGIVAILPPLMIALGGLVTGLGMLISPIGLVVAGLGLFLFFFDDIANAFNTFKAAVKVKVLNSLIRIEEFFRKFLFAPLKTAGRLIKEFLSDGFGGDFSGIVDDMFAEQDEISKDAGKRMAENYLDGAKEALEGQKQGRVMDAIKRIGKKIQNSDIFQNVFGGLGTPSSGGGGTVSTSTTKRTTGNSFAHPLSNMKPLLDSGVTGESLLNQLKNNTELFKLMENRREILLEQTELYNNLGQSVAGVLEQSFHAIAEGGNGFQPIISALKALAIRLLATAAAAALLQALFPAAAAGGSVDKGMSAVNAVKGMMNFTSFAKGGIVSAPTLALVGDNTGAGRGNPEVIAPLNKLQSMIDAKSSQQINVGGQFRVEGQDLVLALQRADRERNRIN
jgi:TP901 family phage tail tape measure protein